MKTFSLDTEGPYTRVRFIHTLEWFWNGIDLSGRQKTDSGLASDSLTYYKEKANEFSV